MPRTLNATLEAALDSGNFQPYFLLTVREVGASVIETATPVSFKLSGIEMEAKWLKQNRTIYDGFTKPQELEFKLTRGVTIAGVNYTIDSSWYFGTSQNWDGIFQTIQASMLPHSRYSAAGDATYQTVIDAICTNYSKTAIYDKSTAVWKSFQFLPTGKTLILNRANDFLTLLKQKRLIYACDNGNDEIRFQSVATVSDLHSSADHSLQIARFKNMAIDVINNRRFLSRDENNTITYSGDTDAPLWNLGFIKSTDAKPTSNTSSAIVLEPIAPHLKYLTFDRFTITFENWPDIDYVSSGILTTNVIEEYNYEYKEIKWRILLSGFDWGGGTEGGALPGTIEAAAPYTPLNTSHFNNNLDVTVNNIQTLADRVDDHTHGITSPANYSASMTNNQTVNAGNNSKLLMDVEIFDNGSYYDPTTNQRWTPPAKLVFIQCKALLTTFVATSTYNLRIYKNGTGGTLISQDTFKVSGAFMASQTSVLAEANGTDYFEIFVNNPSGANIVVNNATSNTNVQGTIIN